MLSAMLLGERSELTEATYLAYQQSGLLHLISVSGMHLMLLGMALRRLLMRCICRKLPRLWQRPPVWCCMACLPAAERRPCVQW